MESMRCGECRDIARLIDHTLLKPDAVEMDILKVCEEAVRFDFASVCTASCWTALVTEKLYCTGGRVKVCSVVGFPFGSALTAAKAKEASAAVESGAEEIDMVINVGYLRSGKYEAFEKDLCDVVSACRNATVKVIIEACYLNDEQIVLAAKAIRRAGAAFIKTSTGYGPAGAKLEDVRLIRNTVPDIQIKASGGVRTYKQAMMFIEAGASRIGTSSGPAIMSEAHYDRSPGI